MCRMYKNVPKYCSGVSEKSSLIGFTFSLKIVKLIDTNGFLWGLVCSFVLNTNQVGNLLWGYQAEESLELVTC